MLDGVCGDGGFVIGVKWDIFGKLCVFLKFFEGSFFVVDYDFFYVCEDMFDMLFMGVKYVDGIGFYFLENCLVVGL